MIFCHKCGSEQLEGSEFCHKCGTKLLTDNNNETAENNVPTETISDNVQYFNTPHEPVASEITAEKGGLNTKLIVLIVVGVLALAVAGVVIALIMTNGKSDTEDTSSFSFAESSIEDENELDATYSSKEKEISFNYPSNWQIDNEYANSLQIYYGINNPETPIAAFALEKHPGKQLNFQSYDSEYTEKFLKDYIEKSPIQFALYYGMSNIQGVDVNQIELDSVPAIKAEFTAKIHYYNEMHCVYYFYDTKYSSYMLMLMYTESERTKYEPIIRSIIESIRVNIDETQEETPTEKPKEINTEAVTTEYESNQNSGTGYESPDTENDLDDIIDNYNEENPQDTVVELLEKGFSDSFGDNMKVEYNNSTQTYEIAVWQDGFAAALNTDEGVYALNDLSSQLTSALADMETQIQMLDNSAKIKFSFLSDEDQTTPLIIIENGEITYSIVD